ncbi:hypothetical protein FACS189485_19570 [Spirochaetia bacterium]|nr:hypothetical protein FACS189485_19570 [Spirochaetia bacterium]
MLQFFIGIIILLAFYAIIINKVDSGRCFRYEYIIKTVAIIGLEIICFILVAINVWPFLTFICFISIMVLMFFSLKFTIQRFYDLNLSGWYILLKLIPIFSIGVTIYLYFKKGDCEINDYDKAINYKKLFKNKHCIDIYKDRFIIDDETYKYEIYLDKYTIKLYKYGVDNFFKEYLLKNYQAKEDNMYKIIEFPINEFDNTINDLGLIVINNSSYLKVKNYEIFIRKENFKYTIIINKENNKVAKELYDFFDFREHFMKMKDIYIIMEFIKEIWWSG